MLLMYELVPGAAMSLTFAVPVTVPSLFQRVSAVRPSDARKKSVWPAATRSRGIDPGVVVLISRIKLGVFESKVRSSSRSTANRQDRVRRSGRRAELARELPAPSPWARPASMEDSVVIWFGGFAG